MPAKVKGVIEMRQALRDFAPNLAKETNKEITGFLKPVVRQARGFLPSNADAPSGWLKNDNAKGRWASRYYDQTEARRGITYRSTPTREDSRGFISQASIRSKNIGGIIYEWAGRTKGITGNFTPRLGGEFKGKNKGMTGRAMFRAYAEDEGKAKAGVIKAIENATATFNRRTR